MPETPYILSNNLAMKAAITVQEGSDATFKKARLADGKRYTRWQSTDTVLKNIDFDVPTAYQRPVTCLILDKSHTLANVQLKWYWSDNGTSWTLVDTWTPTTTAVIFRRFTSQVSHRYYRLELGTTTELHRIYQIWFGEGWSLERNPGIPFDPDAENLDFEDFATEAGVLLRYYRFKKRTIEMNFPIIQAAMYANIKKLFTDFKDYGGFCWFLWRPDTVPSDILYMIQDVKERRFAYPGGIPRQGQIKFSEVLG